MIIATATPGRRAMDMNGRPDHGDVIEKLGIAGRHSDASVRGRITRKRSRVHSRCAIETQEPLHRRLLEMAAGRNRSRAIGAALHHVASGINDFPVERGMMIRILLDDFKVTDRSRMSKPSTRDWGGVDDFTVLIEGGSLGSEVEVNLDINVSHCRSNQPCRNQKNKRRHTHSFGA